jgi:8-oxo-dGTP pyrophosphatase MutT (NUDIX family)
MLKPSLESALELHRQEFPDRESVAAQMLALLRASGTPFSRAQLDPGHFTASAFVLSPDGARLLLISHPKLGRWLQPGGHIEPDDGDCEAAARREVREETGVSELAPLGSGIFDVDVHEIPARPKEGAHRHFDVRYAFVAATEQLAVSEEVKGARWVELNRVVELNSEESLVRCVRRLEGFPLLRSARAR